ncbi:hypothetical protein [Tepidibacter mesophilus]|uniref:hypothetical protein n=1 Tax=Tepidibacter mesophilus TaxID=655607 RepID=UPI000C07337E|nr:hypothetical protein [Tepidibacter mesophilus]
MKKLGTSLIICGMLASSNIVAFADTSNTKDVHSQVNTQQVAENNVKQEQKSIEIMKPVSDYTVTTSDKVVVSGTGEEGSTVYLDVYSKNNKDGALKKNENSKTLKIGAMGFFLTEIKLTPGENKIVIKNNNKEKTKVVKYTKIESKKEIQNNMDKITDKRMKDIFKDIITPKK